MDKGNLDLSTQGRKEDFAKVIPTMAPKMVSTIFSRVWGDRDNRVPLRKVMNVKLKTTKI